MINILCCACKSNHMIIWISWSNSFFFLAKIFLYIYHNNLIKPTLFRTNYSSKPNRIVVRLFPNRGQHPGFQTGFLYLWPVNDEFKGGVAFVRSISEREKSLEISEEICETEKLFDIGCKKLKMILALTSLTLLVAAAMTCGAPYQSWNSWQPGQTCKTVTDVKYRTEYQSECSTGAYK